MLVLSLIVYLLLSIFLTIRIFNEVSISKWIISFFLTVVCGNILISEILHFFKHLDNDFLFLVIQIVLCVVIILVLWDPKKKIFHDPKIPFQLARSKFNLLDGFLTLGIAGVLGFTFYVGTLSPINNLDSLHVHLPRIYYWLQHGSLDSWTATVSTQILYPINISLQGLWVFLMGKSEMLFFLIPWFALVVTVVLVFEIAQLLGASKTGALVSCIVMLSFPVFLLQTYSYQGDVFVSALILCVIYLVLMYLRKKQNHFLFISGLALSVAIGSKQTAILAIPVYGLVLLYMFIRKYISWKTLANTLMLTLGFFVIFSSLKFIQNYSEEKVQQAYMVDPTFYNNLMTTTQRPGEGYVVNFMRYFYQSVSLDGLTGNFRLKAEEVKIKLFRQVTQKIGINLDSDQYLPKNPSLAFNYENQFAVNEDAAWFGPLFYPLYAIAFFVAIFHKNKLTKGYLMISLFLLFLFTFGQVVLKTAWGPYRGRHMSIAVSSFVPLIGLIITQKKIFKSALALLIAICSMILSISVLLFNDSRPLLGQNDLIAFAENYLAKVEVTNIFNSQYRKRLYDLSTDLQLTAPKRASIMHGGYYERLYYQDSSAIPEINFVNQFLDNNDRVYILNQYYSMEYALFGVNQIREVVPVMNYDIFPINSYLIVARDKYLNANNYKLIAESDIYKIFLPR